MIDRCCACKRNGESMDHLLFIVRLLVSFGMFSLVVLDDLGLCLDE
jgi:hypothetical protein